VDCALAAVFDQGCNVRTTGSRPASVVRSLATSFEGRAAIEDRETHPPDPVELRLFDVPLELLLPFVLLATVLVGFVFEATDGAGCSVPADDVAPNGTEACGGH
jgi:hypothetical protein